MPYEVIIGDNFHQQDLEHKISGGRFPTAQAAIAEAKRVIDRSLRHNMLPNIDAAQLFDRFRSFGEITFIFADRGEPGLVFDPWAYAMERASEIAQSG